MVPVTSPFHLSSYFIALFGKYLCFAILALAIDLSGLFGGMSLARPWRLLRARRLCHGHVPDAADRNARRLCRSDPAGLHGIPELPELPVYWYGFQHFAYAAFMVLFVPGLLAFVFGWFAFRSRGHRRLSLHHHPAR